MESNTLIKLKSFKTGQVHITSQECDNNTSNSRDDVKILYGVGDKPPWFLCLLLGFQEVLTAFGGIFAFPLLVKGALCVEGDDVGLGQLISTVLFVGGLSTLVQATFGIRLPIVQGISFAFVSPIFVMMTDRCPYNDPTANSTLLPEKGSMEHREIWQDNLRELQGCLMVASLFPVVIGFSGLVGFLMNYIGPLTVAPTITLIALSISENIAAQSSGHWYICFLTICLVALFSQGLRNVAIPCPCLKGGIKIFALFPVLLAAAISWIVCVILTETNVFTKDPEKWGYAARTDIQSSVLHESNWFRVPYPGQWGVPTVTLAGVLGMMASMLASAVESVGDYYACARLSGAPSPPASAINRGIGVEGLTCILAGVFGSAGGNTSFSENVGAIGITKVGCRRVIQVAGVLMIFLGCLGKFGALFVTLPEPVVGGLFFVMFGMVGAVGISNLQYVALDSPRNLFVLGVSLFFGLSAPNWLNKNPGAINTGNSSLDQVLRVLFGTNMFVGGALAFLMDNLVPGTLKERGLIAWRRQGGADEAQEDLSVYNLPLIQNWLDKFCFIRYIPFCPGFVKDQKFHKSNEMQVADLDEHAVGNTPTVEE